MKIEIISGEKNGVPSRTNTRVKINGKEMVTKDMIINSVYFSCDAENAASWSIGYINPKKSLIWKIRRFYYDIKRRFKKVRK